MCILNTPSPYLQQVLHQHHLGKFLIFLFVGLTFLSNLMKQLQYGCQQKLVNDFIMILLCFQHFQFYSTLTDLVIFDNGKSHCFNDSVCDYIKLSLLQNFTVELNYVFGIFIMYSMQSPKLVVEPSVDQVEFLYKISIIISKIKLFRALKLILFLKISIQYC